MAELLVSVRSSAEALVAVEAGAALIDVKEPANGPLGRANDETIASVVSAVGGRVPVSAALGELLGADYQPCPTGLAYVKWGIAGFAGGDGWIEQFERATQTIADRRSSTQAVVVAYADWRRAAAPCPDDVAAFACRRPWRALLIDTWLKDGSTLLDWVSLGWLMSMRERCRAAGVRVAIAGSLARKQIEMLRSVDPDWFAVRGAACRNGARGDEIDGSRVRDLVVACGAVTPAMSSN